ncbi:uncharacterized protein LOC131433118 [Malaya genurostris]|uniref:uncharacterized protein LOC131433118 n=1 Tax=Malaya genurostris TaxID=325434 RepID=UPI0026F3B906|nr:uncharacterized protein LOC131433118 [Malaya genurostris]
MHFTVIVLLGVASILSAEDSSRKEENIIKENTVQNHDYINHDSQATAQYEQVTQYHPNQLHTVQSKLISATDKTNEYQSSAQHQQHQEWEPQKTYNHQQSPGNVFYIQQQIPHEHDGQYRNDYNQHYRNSQNQHSWEPMRQTNTGNLLYPVNIPYPIHIVKMVPVMVDNGIQTPYQFVGHTYTTKAASDDVDYRNVRLIHIAKPETTAAQNPYAVYTMHYPVYLSPVRKVTSSTKQNPHSTQ